MAGFKPANHEDKQKNAVTRHINPANKFAATRAPSLPSQTKNPA